MNTAFLLMAQYDSAAVIPIGTVCRDFFPHLTPEKLVRKISAGEIALPLLRIEASQKAAKGIHLMDLARWIDERVEVARREVSLTEPTCLFPDEAEIARLVLGPRRAKAWPDLALVLERSGLPRIDPMFGGRYWPAVLGFLQRRNGVTPSSYGFAPDGEENWS